MEVFLRYSGLALWIGLVIWLVVYSLYRTGFVKTVSLNFLLGTSLKKSLEKLVTEYPKDIQKETIVDVAYGVFRRLTRIVTIPFILGILLGVVPYYFLFHQNKMLAQQNKLILSQNDLFEQQNRMFNQQNVVQGKQFSVMSEQSGLLVEQNQKISRELELLNNQNELLEIQNLNSDIQNENLFEQNKLLSIQDSLITIQANLLKDQNNLIVEQSSLVSKQLTLSEASRRSSYKDILLNLFETIQKNLVEQEDSEKLKITKSTIRQIQAASNIFQPYNYLDGNQIIKTPLSPERGFLLIYLSSLNLDEDTFETIFEKTNFNYSDFSNYRRTFYMKVTKRLDPETAETSYEFRPSDFFDDDFFDGIYLKAIKVDGANFSKTQLPFHDFSHSRLGNTNFSGSFLFNCDFSEAKLTGVDFTNANLEGSFFHKTNFKEIVLENAILVDCQFDQAIGLTYELLVNAKSLFNAEGINEEVLQELRLHKPSLFEKPKNYTRKAKSFKTPYERKN